MTITNYSLKEFLQLSDVEILNEYLTILELIPPASEITDPKDENKKTSLNRVDKLCFGDVTKLTELLNEGTTEATIEAVSIYLGISPDDVSNVRIIDFWGIRKKIEKELIEIIERENKFLSSEETDPIMLEVNAGQRLAKFGVINTLDNLAGGDITKYEAIEKLPYLLVFSKLYRDKELSEINKDIAEIQKRKTKN